MIRDDMTLRELAEMPELARFRNYIKYEGYALDFDTEEDREFFTPFRDIGWTAPLLRKTARFLPEMVRAGRAEIYHVWDDWSDDGQKEHVTLARLVPERIDPAKPYIILCSGGAYICVCHQVEGYPTAEHFVDAGYQVFLMTYRVRVPGAVPLALEDVAQAIRFIRAHADEFRLNGDDYAIGGYSAGGNLICTWGLPETGWRRFGLPKPRALFPVYSVTDTALLAQSSREDWFIRAMFGDGADAALIDRYNVAAHAGADYPPSYLVCGRDDEVVPCEHSERLKAALDAAGVPAVLEEADHAPHGFGDGTGFAVAGWPERAAAFLESCRRGASFR